MRDPWSQITRLVSSFTVDPATVDIDIDVDVDVDVDANQQPGDVRSRSCYEIGYIGLQNGYVGQARGNQPA